MNGAHVLVVDDDPDIVEVVSLVLEMSGYRVSRAHDGRSALRMLEHGLPRLILLDMRMPVMDGWAFARELRARYGHQVPILVMTAAEDARLRAREVQAEDVLCKPFDVDALLSAVSHFTAGASEHASHAT